MFTIGRIVFSKAGRDKGLAFVIVSVSGEYVYLSDGKTRTISSPKKKKMKHIAKTNTFFDDCEKLEKGLALDAHIRKALIPFSNEGLNASKEVHDLV